MERRRNRIKNIIFQLITFFTALTAFIYTKTEASGGAGSPAEETPKDTFFGKFGWSTSDPIQDPSDISYMIERGMNIVLLIGGIAFFAMIVWGGIIIGTAAGNQERLESGKKILLAAIVGLLIVIFSKVGLNLFIQFFVGV